MFVFYSLDKEALKKELLEKGFNNFKEYYNLIVFEKDLEEKNLLKYFLLAYKSRNLLDFALLVRDFKELTEIYEFFGIEKSINIKSKVKDKNFIKKIIEKLKKNGFILDKNSLFDLKILDKNVFYLDLLKNNLSKRFYLKFFENKCLNPIICQNFIYFLEIERKKRVVNIKCCLSVFPIELIFYFLDFPGAFKRRDFSLLKLFDLEEELNKIDEEAVQKIERFDEEVFCLSDSTLDVDLSRKVARTVFLESKINFSKIDLFWIDWKFQEKEIDYLISYINETKEINDFFYQAEYLAKNIGLISKKEQEVLNLAKKYELNIIKKKRVSNLNFFYFI